MDEKQTEGVGKTINKIDTFLNNEAVKHNCQKDQLSIFIHFPNGENQENWVFKDGAPTRAFPIEEVSGTHIKVVFINVSLPPLIEKNVRKFFKKKAEQYGISIIKVGGLIKIENGAICGYWFANGQAKEKLNVDELFE